MRSVSKRGGRVKVATSSWLRSWRCKVVNPKVHELTDTQYRFWDMALCLTDNDGKLPEIRDIAFHLRISKRDAEGRLAELVELGFFDPIIGHSSVAGYKAHDWDDWQRFSDLDSTASERKRRQRIRETRSRHGAVTGDVTRDVTEFCSVSVSESESDNSPSQGKNSDSQTHGRGHARGHGHTRSRGHADTQGQAQARAGNAYARARDGEDWA